MRHCGFVPKGVIFDALYMVEGEIQGLQVRVGLTVEGATQEHVQLVVLYAEKTAIILVSFWQYSLKREGRK
jgi:hypothetical protein